MSQNKNHKQYNIGDVIGGELSVLNVFGGKDISGMGVVYLVSDRERDEPYVLKTLQNGLSLETQKRFISEAHAWINAGIHPNIVQSFWVKEIDEQIFIAAEYVEPDDENRNCLNHFLQNGQLRIEIVLNWAAQFCYGMEYASNKGVLCHRDIKPENLMINRDRILKITDFGLAKSVVNDISTEDDNSRWWNIFKKRTNKEHTPISLTRTGTCFGTRV